MSLSYIRPRHGEIARRLVLGQTQAEICRDLEMSQGRMSIIVNSPLFKLEVAKLERERNDSTCDVTKQIREACPDAIETLQRTMYKAKSERLRFDAACDLLDRGGFGAVQKIAAVHATVDTTNMQDSELRDLLINRIQRASGAVAQREEDVKNAAAIDVTFDKVDVKECSVNEHEGEIPPLNSDQANNLIKILGIKS